MCFDVGYSQSPNANPHARVNPEWRGQGAQVLAGGAEEVYMATLCARAFSEDSEDSSDPVIDKEVPDNGFRDISLGYLQVLMPDEKLFIWMQLAAPLSFLLSLSDASVVPEPDPPGRLITSPPNRCYSCSGLWGLVDGG